MRFLFSLPLQTVFVLMTAMVETIGFIELYSEDVRNNAIAHLPYYQYI